MWSSLRSVVKPARSADRPRRGRRAAGINVELLESRQLLTLTPVSSTAPFPYTSIVKLFITFPDNNRLLGSGSIVDTFHVLTAGHCIYSAAHGGFAKSIQVVPEMSGSYQPFGSAYMVYERTYNTFVNYSKAHPGQTSSEAGDIGLLTLDRNIGRYTGSMGYAYDNNNSRFAAGRVFNTAGYPAAGGYDGSRMYASSGPIAGLTGDGRAFRYYQSQITTFGGQSGSPVWEYVPSTGNRAVLGVHVGGGTGANGLNLATRITQTIYNDLGRWRSQDFAPRIQLAALGSSPSSGVGSDDAGAFAAVTNVGPAPTYAGPTRAIPTAAIIVAPPITSIVHRELTSALPKTGSSQPGGQATVKKPLAVDPVLVARPLQVSVRGGDSSRRGRDLDALSTVLNS